MTDSMNFGPEWLRNLSSEAPSGGGTGVGSRYQLAEHRYGREEMLALYEKGLPAPPTLSNFPIYSEQALPPLALTTPTEEERSWQPRPAPNAVSRGRGGSLERGGRISRGRGTYQTYGRTAYEGGGGWGNGEQTEWSPRKDYVNRSSSVDNWRRNRGTEEEDGWRTNNPPRVSVDKWGRSVSWRDGDGGEERSGPPERGNRGGWHDSSRGMPPRRSWDDDNLPEWATENLTEGGGTFDSSGAFHGSDDEQLDTRKTHRKDIPLQKSASQQNISNSSQPSSLPSSKSSASLSTLVESGNKNEDSSRENSSKASEERCNSHRDKLGSNTIRNPENTEKEKLKNKEENSNSIPQGGKDKILNNANGYIPETPSNRVEEDFDKLQEDLVLKLVVEEESPKGPKFGLLGNMDDGGVQPPTQPPPNLAPPPQDKWYYQDPQKMMYGSLSSGSVLLKHSWCKARHNVSSEQIREGDMQGPFPPSEMAEWFRAGYFTTSLMVRRQCDERFCMLGDLVTLCGGNPFQNNLRIGPLKVEQPKIHEDAYQFHLLQTQLALRQAAAKALGQTPGDPWSSLTAMQQRDLVTQHMLHQQVPPDVPYMPQANPLMHMINQMQQAGKLGGVPLPDKPPNPMPPLDPIQALVQQMGGLQGLQNRLPNAPSGLPPVLQPGVMPGPMPTPGLPATLATDLPGLQPGLPLPGMGPPLGGAGVMPGGLPPRPTPLGAVDPLSGSGENDPIKNLLRQLQNQKQQQTQQMDSMWQQNQFPSQPVPSQWQHQQPQQQQQQPEVPLSMWDLQAPSIPSPAPIPTPPASTEQPQQQPASKPAKVPETPKQTVEKEVQPKEEQPSLKELKKKKEQEEKQAKKEQEEKRKAEQKKQEMEKKAAEEKKKKEEERVRKELEKAKKEAEEKRLRELEEKRRLKEQRKAEEQKKKEKEEQKKLEDEEKKREVREKEEVKKQTEAARQQHANAIPPAKVAPWCQPSAATGTSLEEIQKAERVKRAEQAALQQQRALQQLQQQQQQQEQQQSSEKSIHLKWANKPIEPRKVKSLAEIQAEEEHERLTKLAEQRLITQQKEKDAVPTPSAGIWSGQNLTWANNTASQWSNSTGGFWDDAYSQKTAPVKPAPVSKSVSSSAVNMPSSKPKQSKSKVKKEEQQVMKVFNNSNAQDDFTEWCIKTLADINSSVDVPTFVTFLRDIESAIDVREYCKEYLGESPAMQQFASEFLEKRRSFKPKTNQHKDDMCSPAPAITPSSQHSSEFQEVKGKSKKAKKSKMMKVDSRILGFNVTAARDRINVGDLERLDNL